MSQCNNLIRTEYEYLAGILAIPGNYVILWESYRLKLQPWM